MRDDGQACVRGNGPTKYVRHWSDDNAGSAAALTGVWGCAGRVAGLSLVPLSETARRQPWTSHHGTTCWRRKMGAGSPGRPPFHLPQGDRPVPASGTACAVRRFFLHCRKDQVAISENGGTGWRDRRDDDDAVTDADASSGNTRAPPSVAASAALPASTAAAWRPRQPRTGRRIKAAAILLTTRCERTRI